MQIDLNLSQNFQNLLCEEFLFYFLKKFSFEKERNLFEKVFFLEEVLFNVDFLWEKFSLEIIFLRKDFLWKDFFEDFWERFFFRNLIEKNSHLILHIQIKLQVYDYGLLVIIIIILKVSMDLIPMNFNEMITSKK